MHGQLHQIAGEEPRRLLSGAARVRIGVREAAHPRDRHSASRDDRRDQAVPTTVTHEFPAFRKSSRATARTGDNAVGPFEL
ncbi:hypothetical protein GCM10010347_01530 [Streptomyces cirratus]|uniref:Uncharacterized protein n=1 Tax=Streptomyces cirratus TaxID=68187 RepID=A0ABQ3EI99_9ACTN|nr:hypothetical protein GCM10010347_01530 [Streptomyces cirratus]